MPHWGALPPFNLLFSVCKNQTVNEHHSDPGDTRDAKPCCTGYAAMHMHQPGRVPQHGSVGWASLQRTLRVAIVGDVL